jgi:cyclohexadienyl dehydratase
LAVIMVSGTNEPILRVGTTGDYPPLTYHDPQTGRYSGQDIALIETFASDQGYRLELVPTTWPTLMQDLMAGSFRVAVGGISKTHRRATQALVSKPLAITGKVALARRGEEMRYASIKAIDTPETTVVEDRGGTNEEFALANIEHAVLILLPDNQMPFAYLLDRRADVMFTDSVEAVYRQQTTPGLCAVHPDEPYTRVEKVFLFRKDEVELRDRFDRWFAMQPGLTDRLR